MSSKINTIVFDSRTNNIKRFVQKLNKELPDLKLFKIGDSFTLKEDDSALLITYTTGIGQASKSTLDFLKENYKHVNVVCVSGNMNWGNNYGKALEVIVDMYPNINKGVKFEMSGTKEDLELVKNIIKNNNNIYGSRE